MELAHTGGQLELVTRGNGLMAACMAWVPLRALMALGIREAGCET